MSFQASEGSSLCTSGVGANQKGFIAFALLKGQSVKVYDENNHSRLIISYYPLLLTIH